MLVLTRKVNESIMIGDDVRVVVIAVAGNQVRLGIQAPHELAIRRSADIIAGSSGVPELPDSKPDEGFRIDPRPSTSPSECRSADPLV